jgi:hypothetical protein
MKREFLMPRRIRNVPFLRLKSAPRDGTVIEVLYGSELKVARAFWSANSQAFVRESDEIDESLHHVTGWRPVR